MRRLGSNPEIKDVLRVLEDLSRDVDAVRSGRLLISNDIDMRGYKLTGLPTPEDTSDAQPKIGDMTGEFAPLDSAYAVVGNLDGDLPNERLLSGSSSITLTDGGAGSTLAISATQAFFDALYQALDEQLTSLAALTYAGNTLKVIRVNAGETGFELSAASAIGGGGPNAFFLGR